MYAFVDVADYQKVIVSDSSQGIEAAAKKYLGDAVIEYDPNTLEERTITVNRITSAVVDSNTYYFITDENNELYSASIKINKDVLPFVDNEDVLKVTFSKGNVNQITKIEKSN